MSNNSLPRWPVLMHSPMWLNAFSFSNRIMFFIRLSLICGEILETPMHNIRTPNGSPWHPYHYLWQNLRCTTPLSCIQESDYTVPRHVWLLQQPNCLVWSQHLWTYLILFWWLLHVPYISSWMVIPCAPISYDTVLMLLHVIICLWFHPSILMMGRKSQEQLMVLNTFLRNHTTSMTKW
jgi:hypothetical protein